MKNRLTQLLISLSLVLLIILQGLWLRSSYDKAYFDLRREANGIFRSTFAQLRDSVFTNTINSSFDSLSVKSDSLSTMKAPTLLRFNGKDIKSSKSTIQVLISSSGEGDSLQKRIRPLHHRIVDFYTNNNEKIIVRIAPDSLNTDSLAYYFKKNLQQVSINLPVIAYKTIPNYSRGDNRELQRPSLFEFIRAEPRFEVRKQRILSDTLEVEPVRLSYSKRYAASLTGVKAYVLKEITPQILFSLLLTITIIAAFYMLYKNLRSQQKHMQLKNEFISNITHELKTPVATVSVALEALQRFDASHPERNQEYIAMAQQELNRLTVLTDKILKTTIFEEIGINGQFEKIEFNKLLEEAVKSIKLLIERSGAVVRLNTPMIHLLIDENGIHSNIVENKSEIYISGNAEHLTGMITNLLENSMKYSNEKPVIEIELTQNSSNINLRVADNGIGIAKEFQRKVFDKFFRVPTGDVHTVKGYGLGLSYVASVVKAHKGNITLQSETGKGTTFYLSFPIFA